MIARQLLLFLFLVSAGTALGQGTTVPFSGLSHDASLPVEIAADNLELNQGTGTAVFSGGVQVAQGALRLSAEKIEVYYAEDANQSSGSVESMKATGEVRLSNGAEAAEAETAEYFVADGVVEMEGNVLLTQGNNALSSERLRINLVDGTATLDGRVQTIFDPATSQ